MARRTNPRNRIRRSVNIDLQKDNKPIILSHNPQFFTDINTAQTTPETISVKDTPLQLHKLALNTVTNLSSFGSSLAIGGVKPGETAIGRSFIETTPATVGALQQAGATGLRVTRGIGESILEDIYRTDIPKNKSDFISRTISDLEEAASENTKLSQILQQQFAIENPDIVLEGLNNKEYAGRVIGSAFNSFLGIFGASSIGFVTGGPKGAVVGGLSAGVSLEGGMAINEAREFLSTSEDPKLREKANDNVFLTKVGLSVGIINGMLEALPIQNFFARSPIGSKLKSNIFKKALNRIFRQGSAESATETLQEIVANAVAQVYDENQELFEGTTEAAYGGFVMGGGLSIIGDTQRITEGLPAGLSIQDVSGEQTILGAEKPNSPDKVREFAGIKRTDKRIVRREKTLLKERIKKIEQKEKSKVAKESAIAREVNKYENKIEKINTVERLSNLKNSIQQREKGKKQGERRGRKTTIKEITAVQGLLKKIVKDSGLSLKDQAKFIDSITNTKTFPQLFKRIDGVVARINKLTDSEILRNQKSQIKKELQTTKVKIQSGKKKGKFTPMIQDVLDTIRKAYNQTSEQRLNRLQKLQEKTVEGLNPQEQNEIQILSAFSNGDYAGILSLVRKIKESGRNINELLAFNRFAVKEQNVEKAVGVVTGGKKIPERTDFNPNENFKDKLKRLLFTTGESMMHLQSLMDVLSSNDTESKTFNSFLNQHFNFQEQISNEKFAIETMITTVSDNFAKIFGLEKKKDIARKYREDSAIKEIGTFKDSFGNERNISLSKSEARKKHMEFQDPTIDNAYTKNGWTQEMKDAVSNTLTKQDKQFVAYQLELYKQYYKRINPVYRKIYGVNLGFFENYSPIRREGFDPDTAKGYGEFMTEGFARSSIANASLKQRQQSKLRIKDQSDLVVLANYISQMEHFINFAEKMQSVRDVSDDPRFKKAVAAFYGEKSNRNIEGFLDDITTSGMTRAIRNEKLESLMSSMATGVLAIKPVITFKQLSSAPAFAAQIPIKSYIKYQAQFWKNPIKNSKFLFNNSKDLKTRGFNVTRDMLRMSKTQEYKKIMSRQRGFSDIVSLNIMVGDKGAIIAGGYPIYAYHYNNAKNKGKSEADSQRIGILEFEKAFNITQQTAHLPGLSPMQRGGIFTRLWTAFLSSPNLYLQYEAAALRGVISGRMSKAEAAKIVFIFHVLLPNLFVLVGNAFDDDKLDGQDHLLATIIGPLSGIFVVGDMISSITRTLMGMQTFDKGSPIFRIAKESEDLIKTLQLEDVDVLRIAEDLSSLAETLPFVAPAGAVTSQTLKSAEGINDILNGNIEDGLGLLFGYTRYAVGKTGKEKTEVQTRGERGTSRTINSRGRRTSGRTRER